MTTTWHLGDIVRVHKTGETSVVTHVGSVPMLGTEVERNYMLASGHTYHGYELEWAK